MQWSVGLEETISYVVQFRFLPELADSKNKT